MNIFLLLFSLLQRVVQEINIREHFRTFIMVDSCYVFEHIRQGGITCTGIILKLISIPVSVMWSWRLRGTSVGTETKQNESMREPCVYVRSEA